MEYNDILNNFNKQLKKESFIKSIFFSSILSFSISIIVLLIILFNFLSEYLFVIIFSIIIFLNLVLLIYIINKPNEKILSTRIDLLGLKERVLTMNELKGNDSFIANKQREDTIKQLDKIKNINLINISKKLKYVSISITLLYLCTVTFTVLAANGVIPHFKEENTFNPYIELDYSADTGGVVLGETSQLIFIGESATEVLAVANSGYVFLKWSDGVVEPYRKDININSKQVIVAYFTKLDDNDIQQGDSDILDFDEDGNMNDGSGGDGASGEYDDTANNVVDGNTNYKDLYEQYYQESLDIISSGGTVPEYLKDLIDYYYKIIS